MVTRYTALEVILSSTFSPADRAITFGGNKISCVRLVRGFFTTFSIDCSHAVSAEDVLSIAFVSPIIQEFTATSLFYCPSVRLCPCRFSQGDLFGTPELRTFFTVPGDMYRAKYSAYEYGVPRRVSTSSGFVSFSFFSLRVEENSIDILLFRKRDRAVQTRSSTAVRGHFKPAI